MERPSLLNQKPKVRNFGQPGLFRRVPRTFGGILIVVLLILVTAAFGQPGKGEDVAKVSAFLSHERVHAEETFQVAVVVDIEKGYHINSNKPLDEFLVPTFLKLDKKEGVLFGLVSYPEPAMMSFSFSTHEVAAYDGKVTLRVQGKLSEDVPLGTTMISGHMVYQACDDHSCLMPKSVKFELPLEVVGIGEPTREINKEIFEEKIVLTTEEEHAKRVIERGLPYAIIAFFLFGLALNLTPCVYPVIPMTVSFFGAQSSRGKWSMLLLASYYVFGIAVIFSVLGLVSGLAGKQWGFLFQNPWFVIFISITILAMAASMFGAFEITIPSFLMTPLSKSRQGAVGSFIMGLTVGVVIAPCAAGIIIGLIGVVAKLGMVAKGTFLFFTMGLGLGLPYLFLAMFSGLMTRLPRSGMWMVWVRKFFGILLIGVAVYFLLPQGKQVADQQGFYLGVLGLFGGLFLGFLDSAEGYTRAFKMIRGCLGLALIFCGVYLVHGAIKGDGEGIDWVVVKEQQQLLTKVQAGNRPVVIDFTAEWCSICKVLDRKTFKSDDVVEKSKTFLMVRVDCTSPTEEIAELTDKFQVTGLPTVVFLDRKGNEVKDYRITGFMSPSEMIARMENTAAK